MPQQWGTVIVVRAARSGPSEKGKHMTDASKFDRETWLRKIEALLAKAESAEKLGSTDEAAAFRAGAERLMNKHRIEEEELREATPAALQLAPVTRKIRVCDYRNPFADNHVSLFYAAVYHSGCKGATATYDPELKATVGYITGFDIDVKYAEILFLNASLVFSAHLEPAYDRNETEAENIYRLRHSGKTRREIAVALWGVDVDHSVPAHGRVQKIYEAECARRGSKPISGRGFNHKVYTEIYAESFESTFRSRLYRARVAAGLSADGEIVLANRKERVEEAYYEAHPHLRPVPEDPNAEPRKDTRTDAEKKRDEEKAEKRYLADCAKRASSAGRVGSRAGAAAAEKVSLRGTTSKGRLGEGE
jgi:hypothetical protein